MCRLDTEKVRFKSNVSGEIMPGFVAINGKAYTGIQDFTKVDLGAATGNNAYYPIVKTDETENSRYFLKMFDEIWNDTARTKDVTKEVLDRIAFLYNENSPEFLYFVILYKILVSFWMILRKINCQMKRQGSRTAKSGIPYISSKRTLRLQL